MLCSLMLFFKLLRYFNPFFKENVLKIVPMMVVIVQWRKSWLTLILTLTSFVTPSQNSFYQRWIKSIMIKFFLTKSMYGQINTTMDEQMKVLLYEYFSLYSKLTFGSE